MDSTARVPNGDSSELIWDEISFLHREFYDPVNKFFPNQHIPALSNKLVSQLSLVNDR